MYKLLILGTMVGIGIGVAKFMKNKKQDKMAADNQ